MSERMKAIHEFFRLLGMAVNTPSQSAELELGRFVVANRKLLVDLITGESVVNYVTVYEWMDKYGLSPKGK